MDNKQSDDLLHQLHELINSIDTVDEKGCELLEDLDKDIRLLLERSGERPDKVRASAVRRLEHAISYFEVTHPELTELLNKVMSSLSNAGV
jgi:hypothetical protein